MKSLMDDIIVTFCILLGFFLILIFQANEIGGVTDFGSYCIEMVGSNKYSVSFRKKVMTHKH